MLKLSDRIPAARLSELIRRGFDAVPVTIVLVFPEGSQEWPAIEAQRDDERYVFPVRPVDCAEALIEEARLHA